MAVPPSFRGFVAEATLFIMALCYCQRADNVNCDGSSLTDRGVVTFSVDDLEPGHRFRCQLVVRQRLVLPVAGLALFLFGSWKSVQFNRELHHTNRYFWWSAIRLDSDPLGIRPPVLEPCPETPAGCAGWDPSSVWIDPGPLAQLLILTALPAFAVGAVIVKGMGRVGVNEIWTFMFAMPFLIVGWYYLLGRLIDHRALMKSSRRARL